MAKQTKTSNYTLPTKPELEDAYQALWATLQNKLGPYFSDYGQLIEKGSPLNNQYQQLKSNISQHIPSNADFRSPQRMSEWAQAAALNAPMGLTLSKALKRYKGNNIDDSFRGSHTAPMYSDSTAALHELDKVYPDDVYSRQAAQYYGHGENPIQDRSLFNQFLSLRGKPDEMVDVYRAIPKDAPMEINHGDWVTTNAAYAKGHGESVLGGNYKIKKMKVPAKVLFTNGDSPYEFGVDLSRAADVSSGKLPPTKYSRAHDIAQKNAALPVEQGGLGLPLNNTAMDRARAMGFDTPAYHGTSKQRYVESTDIPFFDETKIGDKWGQDERGFSFTNKPDEASYYAASDRDYYNPGEGEGAIYPVLLNKGNTLTKNIKNNDTVNYWDSNHEKIQKEALKKLSDSVLIRDASRGVDMNVIFDPKNIRSRFAAFDPMKKDSANILASILGATTLAGMYEKEKEQPTTLRSVMERKLKR